jgi:hypothetical protein
VQGGKSCLPIGGACAVQGAKDNATRCKGEACCSHGGRLRLKTFIHRFSKSVSCVCEIADEPPEPGILHDRQILWKGQPKRKHIRTYVAWQNEINRMLSSEWQMKLMHCFRVAKGKWEFWCYEPNHAPKLEKIGSEPEQPYCEATHVGAFINDDSLDE